MQSHLLLSSAALVTALVSPVAPAWAAGPGAAPTPESLASAPVRSGTAEDDFWELWKRGESGFNWKGISILPSVNYRAFYTDNLFNFQQGTDTQDFVHYLSPQLALSRFYHLGNWQGTLSAGYTPTFVVHSLNGRFDRNYHLARVGLSAVQDERSLNLGHTYNLGSETTSELGFLVEQESHQTQLSYQQPLTGKMSLQTSASQGLTDSSSTVLTSARNLKSWGGDAFVMYDWLPKTRTGLGVGVNYQVQDGSLGEYRSVFERVTSRWNYLATGKIDLSLDVGVQFGQSLDTGSGDPSPTPVMRAAIQYAPRYGTTFSLSAARTSGLSQLQSAQISTENTVTLGVRQRVYQTMSANLSVGYGHGSFGDTRAVAGVAGRTYDNYTLGFQYTWQASDRWQVTGFYQFLRRESDFAQDTFSNNQIGFTVGFSL